MDEVEFQREARRLIEMFDFGALVPLDVARRARGNESYSGIYAAMARGDLDARKLGGKTDGMSGCCNWAPPQSPCKLRGLRRSRC
jgi:hypothetical protein